MRIGVFDSGMGGITVLNELTKRLPDSEFFYFGDTANVPYGTKSNTQIQQLVTSASIRMKQSGLDALVIACNTAASLAHAQFKAVFQNIPLIDVVEAGVKSVMKNIGDQPDLPVLILGTRATVKSKIYSRLLGNENRKLQVLEQECPLLVPMIEEGWLDHPILHETVEVYTEAYRGLKPGVALLACTHYPWIRDAFQKALPGWNIINSAHAVAEILNESLNLKAPDAAPQLIPSFDFSWSPKVKWHFSDPESVSRALLQSPTAELSTF
jgi:glutamate racemase